MRVRFSPALLLLACPFLWAQETGTSSPVPQTLEQADTQRQRAEAMRKEADKRHTEEQAACYRKILVNSCLADAKKRHTASMIEARQLDLPAREFQREANRKNVEAEKALREAERPAREAEQQEQAERYRTEEAAKAAERMQKQQENEKKAVENRNKLAEEQARRKAKEEQRARKNAAQIEKKAKERAKAEAKAAAKIKSE